jgi:polysaccharide chain length determinant protein (PEP-CTERM system associated)
MQEISLAKQLETFVNEVIDKRVLVSIAFAIVSITILVTGVFWPKVYESKASILWSNTSSLSPLLEQDVARATTINDQAEIAREIILSNKILDQLIDKAGLGVDANGRPLGERQRELIKGGLRRSIKVSNLGKRLIVISYRSKDPEKAYLIASIVSELFIQETRAVKNQSSQAAYDFINRQVQDYKNKLDKINREIIEFRKQNVDLDSDTRTGVNNRVNTLKNLIRETRLQLTEAQVQKKSLQEQLSRERRRIEQQLAASRAQASNRVIQSNYEERLKSLQSRLDTLRLSYTDDYPDIIQLKEQIRNLKLQIEQEKQDRANAPADAPAPPAVAFEPSPLYENLSNEIANIETTIKTLEARIEDASVRLDKELERANLVNALESQLEEMTRDLDVTQAIYDDLLTRRENARVSLNLQLENQGSTFKIQEPAVVPLVPVGLRFLHFALASLALGVLVPLGLIFALVVLDPRIRNEEAIDPEVLDIPIIGVVGHYANDRDKQRERRKTRLSIAIVSLTLAALATIVLLKINQYIGA